MSNNLVDKISPKGVFHISCMDTYGNIKWSDLTQNMVVTQGKNDLFNKYFNGSAYTSAFFVGIKGPGDIALTDTALSHPAWTEITSYSGGLRPAFIASTSSDASVNNNANAAIFTMTSAASVAGCLISTTASGVSGILFSAANFASTRTASIGDTIIITYTVSC